MEIKNALKKWLQSFGGSHPTEKRRAEEAYAEIQATQTRETVEKTFNRINAIDAVDEADKKNGAFLASEHEKQKTAAEIATIRDEQRKKRWGKVKENFRKVAHPDRVTDKTSNKTAWYLAKNILTDSRTTDTLLQNIENVIDKNPRIAELLDTLFTGGAEVHGDPIRLMDTVLNIQLETHGRGVDPRVSEALKPVLDAANDQVTRVMIQRAQMAKAEAKQHGRKDFDTSAFLADEFKIPLEKARQILGTRKELQERLKTIQATLAGSNEEAENEQEGAVQNMIKGIMGIEPEEHPDIAFDFEQVAAAVPDTLPPPPELTEKVDAVWGDLVSRVNRGENVTLDDYRKYESQMMDLISSLLPKEVLPGTPESKARARSLFEQVKNRRDLLMKKIVERQALEPPTAKTGLTPEEFLTEMNEAGQFGNLLRSNPEIRKQLTDYSEEAAQFRDRVFLKLHSNVIIYKLKDSRDSFGMYERIDFTNMVNIIKSHMNKRQDVDTGKTVGEYLAEHYSNLSEAIVMSRDIDHAAQIANIDGKKLSGIVALYPTALIQESLAIPAVSQAFRIYETNLRGIEHTNNGWIPPSWVEYDAVTRGAKWDTNTKNDLVKLSRMGQVFDVARDEKNGFLNKVDESGKHLMIDTSQESVKRMQSLIDKDNGLALDMYMTLAKGLGIASGRYLEIFSNSKVPGNEQPIIGGVPRFRSKAGYEAAASLFNPIDNIFHKYHMGSYKYFYLMNTLLPEEKRILQVHNDADAAKVYIAYRDGTLAKKNPEAVRLLDKLNLSRGASSLKSQWRYMDMTIGMTDKGKEKLGSARMFMAQNYATEKVEDLLIHTKYKLRFYAKMAQDQVRDHFDLDHEKFKSLSVERQMDIIRELEEKIKRENEQRLLEKRTDLLPETLGSDEFKRLYDTDGKAQYQSEIFYDTMRFQGKTREGNFVKGGTKDSKLFKQKVEQYTKAYRFRSAVETAMRNPLAIGHMVKVEVPLIGGDETKDVRLHDLLIQKILGPSPTDMQYSTVIKEVNGTFVVSEKAGKYATPTKEQNAYTTAMLDFEGDLAAVREIAIREQRDLTEADFNIIEKSGDKEGENGPERKKRALEYWRLTRRAMLGSENLGRAEQLYEASGLTFDPSSGVLADYNIDWQGRVANIDNTIESVRGNVTELDPRAKVNPDKPLIAQLANKDGPQEFHTDDMAIDQLDFMGMGSRMWFRKIGDAAGHEEGMSIMTGIMDNHIKAFPNQEELAKELKKMVQAFAADDISLGYAVCGPLAWAIRNFYVVDLTTGMSQAQKVFGGRMNAEAWWPNEEWQWWRALKREDALPPNQYTFDMGSDTGEYTISDLMEKSNVMPKLYLQMALTISVLLAALIVWESLKEKEEDQ